MGVFKYEMNGVVQHRNTAFEGTIICRAEYVTHNKYLVQSPLLFDGKIMSQWVEENEIT